MVFGPDGNLFITNNSDSCNGDIGEGGQVLAFSGTTGAFLGVAVPNLAGEDSGPNGLSEAMALAFGPDGTLYVGNDPRMGSEACALGDKGFTEGLGIAFGPDKHLYVGSGDTS